MDDMREDFAAAIEANEGADEALQETEQTVDEYVSEEEPNEQESADSGSEDGDDSVRTEIEASDTSGDTTPTASESTSGDSIKAPESWGPKDRGNWSKVPRDLQETIIARETAFKEQVESAKQSEGAGKFLEGLQREYAPILAAEGVSAPQAIKGLLDTVSQLRVGSQQQKAQAVANIISDYGVDVNILDSHLVGQPVEESPNSEIERLLEQRLAPVNQLMSTLQQQQAAAQQTTQQQAHQSVSDFSQGKEFFNDVRLVMADLLDMADKQGQTLTLDDAYAKACILNPEISQIMDDRRAQESIMGGNKSIAAKRAAASSLNGKQHGISSSNGSLSLRDQISAAWEGS